MTSTQTLDGDPWLDRHAKRLSSLQSQRISQFARLRQRPEGPPAQRLVTFVHGLDGLGQGASDALVASTGIHEELDRLVLGVELGVADEIPFVDRNQVQPRHLPRQTQHQLTRQLRPLAGELLTVQHSRRCPPG